MPRNGVDRRGAASPRTFEGDGRESAHEGEHDQLVRAWASTDCERSGDGLLGLLFEASLRLRVIVHLSCQIPGSLSVLTSCKALKFFGRRAITSRTPICTVSVASAATGTCQGAEGMICWAGSTPWRISR